MNNTQTPPKKRLQEQTAHYVYGQIPKRASANVATTEEPPASRHHAGHYAGIHPEDTPYTTKSKLSQRQQSRPPTHAPQDDEVYNDPPRLPSSVRRYDPFTMREGTKPTNRRGAGFYTLIVGCSLLAGICIATLVPPLWQRASDQFHYGFPRTYQTDANVGHGSARYPDSHFIVLNNHGYVEVIELPQGMPAPESTHLYLVARPENAQSELATATVEFEDVNGDGKKDMVVHCNNNLVILYNDGKTFKEKL